MSSYSLRLVREDASLFAPAAVVLVAICALGVVFFLRSNALMQHHIKQQLKTAAAIGAMQFPAEEVEAIRSPRDIDTPVFHRVVERLKAIRQATPNARFAYIFRRTDDPNLLEFVADADALSTLEELDINRNGTVEPDEEPGFPGDLYSISEIPELKDSAFREPTVGDVYIDQWGALLSGFAPIRAGDGRAVATMGMDITAEEFLRASRSVFSPTALLLSLLIGVLVASYLALFLWHRRTHMHHKLDMERMGIISLAMHQIGGPLASLRWWTDILKEQEPVQHSKTYQEAMREIHGAITRMDKIIENLHEASLIHSGKMAYTPQPTSLREIIDGVAKDLEHKLKVRKQQLEIRMDSDLTVDIDRKLISGVIHELIINASAYAPQQTTITLSAHRDRREAIVEVRDEGCGIAKQDLPRLFRAFTRGSTAAQHKPSGNGLGLFIARGIVERAGGRMWLTSKEGQGTTVTFTLPCEEGKGRNAT